MQVLQKPNQFSATTRLVLIENIACLNNVTVSATSATCKRKWKLKLK